MVIADDENLVRLTLKSMISEMEAAWQIVGEATNGEELLDLLAEHQPNVAIVDIRMPKMNGLEAIRFGKSRSPLTKWVILSGYSDFEYAKEALKLCASEYLLKPVSPAELERALYDTYKDNKDLTGLLNQQFENNLSALVNGLISLEQEDREGLFYRGRFIGCVFLLDGPGTDSRESGAQRDFYKDLLQCVNDHLSCGMNLALLALPSGELAAVGAWDPDRSIDGRRQVLRFFTGAEEIASGCQSRGMTVTMLETGDCLGFKEVNGKLQQLQQWGGLRTIGGIGRRVDYRELEKEAENSEKAEAGRLLSAARQHFQDRMYLNYQHTVDELEGVLTKSDLMRVEKSRRAIRSFIRYSFDVELPDHAGVAEVIRELRKYGERFLRGMKQPDNAPADLVQQMMRYIDSHYTDDIRIGQIAGQLSVSANYLSTLFHKKTGVTFLKYLTRIRMIKAEELLLNTNLQIKQIAEEIGYFSTRHFTKLFTETFGRYPSDYRKNSWHSSIDT
jgi:two-component system response regulator YesN